ncbi:MAG: HepT-like ribonuclease domain-containing protein [Pseudomonadota bacterium]|nr:HepT-like ribonuclease domain-containing protein [Pseudomonadota bacterium]
MRNNKNLSIYRQSQIFTDIPWYQMKGMRNLLIHEYFGVDIDVLWKTIQEDLPALKIKIEKLLLQT